MSSPLRPAQLQADRAARVNYQKALQQALEEEKLADPAYQARVEQAKIDRQEREAYQEQRSQDFQDNWNARFREVFPNAPIPGSAEAAAFNPITISRDAGVMKPLAAVRNQAYQDTGTPPPNTQLLMPNGTIRPITSVYPEYMDKQMEKVGEEIFDYYRGAADKAKAGIAAYQEAWKPATKYNSATKYGSSGSQSDFSSHIQGEIAAAFKKHGMSRTRSISPWQMNASSPRFGVATTFKGSGDLLTPPSTAWFQDAMARKAAPILAATADVRARHREPKFMSSLTPSPRMSIGFKNGGLGSYPYTRPHTFL